MTNAEYPCNACAKRERCTGKNYQRCPEWCAWFHIRWIGLEGAEDRVRYKAWLYLTIQRSTWRKEKTE